MRRCSFALALILVLAATAQADSLWTNTSSSLFADRRARAVGDLLTVAVVESVSTTHVAEHQTKKEAEAETAAGTGLLSFFPDLSLSAARSTEGSGASTAATRITDRLTVKVTAIDPQGNLCIAGDRTLELSADRLELHFSGKVRPEDIDADNLVLSTSVADLQVTWSAKGPIAEKQKPGLLMRLLHWLW